MVRMWRNCHAFGVVRYTLVNVLACQGAEISVPVYYVCPYFLLDTQNAIALARRGRVNYCAS